MHRRGFLKGLLVSASAATGTALVKLATPQEAAALTAGEPALVAQPQSKDFEMPDWSAVATEVYMRRVDGQFVAVGHMTQLDVRQEVDRYLSWTGEVVMTPGLREMRMLFEGRR